MLAKKSQDILCELQNFIVGINQLKLNDPHQKLTSSSLILLSALPATKTIVFDYFSVVFDSAVAIHLSKSHNNEVDDNYNEHCEAINSIQDALEDLIQNGSSAWSPMISNWSLNLLGKLSDKYSHRRSMDVGTASTLWLASPAMRCLLGISALCFEKLDSSETEECISNLLNIFVRYSPNFDWVVARLGGYFPLKVISKILHCGLKEFSGNQNNLLDSEIGILGYLSYSHEAELNVALQALVMDVRSGKSHFKESTFPYILHLAEISDILSQTIVKLFLNIFDEDLKRVIQSQFKMWPPNWNIPAVIMVLSKLILKTLKNGTLLILLLAENSHSYDWCKELLELLLIELESKAGDDAPIPLLKDLMTIDSRQILWEKCLYSDTIMQHVALRLLLLCSYRTPTIFCQTVSQLLISEAAVPQTVIVNSLKRFSSLPTNLVSTDIMHGIFLAVQQLPIDNNTTKKNTVIFLRNLVNIVKLEQSGTHAALSKKTSFSFSIAASFNAVLLLWKIFIDKATENLFCDLKPNKNCEIAPLKRPRVLSYEQNVHYDSIVPGTLNDEIHLIAELLQLLDLHNYNVNLKLSNDLLLSKLLVRYFFLCLISYRTTKNYKIVQRCLDLLSRQCNGRKSSQSAALRELLEGALFTHRNLFGSQLDDEPFLKKSDELSLLKANQTQDTSMITFRSLILHAGIIGSGPKQPRHEACGPDSNVKTFFMNALEACCSDPELTSKIDCFNYISLLLIEYFSTDVMYNGFVWPEEDFTKITMERDLQIRRALLDNPIIWSVLGLISTCRPSLCICSIILRALCASVLHQWRASSAENGSKTADTDIMQVTIRLLKLLSMSQILPPPLEYLYIIVPHLDPSEIAYLMKECVWNFMKDFVPSPILFGCDISGLHWRDPTVARPPAKFIDPLRYIMQKNIKIFGCLFHQIFSMVDEDMS